MTAIGAHVTRGHRAYAERLALGLPSKPHIRGRRPTRAPLTVPGAITRADWRAMIRAEREQVAQLLTYSPPARELSDEEVLKRAIRTATKWRRQAQLQRRRTEARAAGYRSLAKYYRDLRLGKLDRP